MRDHWAVARNVEAILDCHRELKEMDSDVFVKLLNNVFIKYRMAESIPSYMTLVTTNSEYETKNLKKNFF